MIAALYVQTGGCYFGLEGVDPWDEARDARKYAGPWPVVAHPPCERWGRYWYGGPMLHKLGRRRTLGDDGGCFEAALASVRAFGGVLEHPEASHAWRRFSLNAPPHSGGWVTADFVGGWTCCVEQGHYGHRARKKTWLYVNYGAQCDCGHGPDDHWGGTEDCMSCSCTKLRAAPSRAPAPLVWGRSAAGVRLDQGYHSKEERRAAQRLGTLRAKGDKRMPRAECAATPIPFRDLLLSIARSAARSEAA